jgi:hypothetical protein
LCPRFEEPKSGLVSAKIPNLEVRCGISRR